MCVFVCVCVRAREGVGVGVSAVWVCVFACACACACAGLSSWCSVRRARALRCGEWGARREARGLSRFSIRCAAQPPQVHHQRKVLHQQAGGVVGLLVPLAAVATNARLAASLSLTLCLLSRSCCPSSLVSSTLWGWTFGESSAKCQSQPIDDSARPWVLTSRLQARMLLCYTNRT